MKAVNIIVEHFEFQSILEFDCCKEFNNHGFLKIKGIISNENAHLYSNMAREELWICVKVKDDDIEKIFFCGVLTQFNLCEEASVYTMTIELRTGSYLMDRSLHIRSFQDDSFTYETVIDSCLQANNEYCIMREKQKDVIDKLILQYRETNWSFVKRLAGYLNTVLIPEFATKGKRIYLGCENKNARITIQSGSYRFEKGYSGLVSSRQNNEFEKFPWMEQGFYVIKLREVYELGEVVQFQGINYLIGKITSQLLGEELSHEYYLTTVSNTNINPFHNSLLRGISLKATVKNVQKDKVQIEIHDDENKRDCRFRWFDYATVYSTPDGTGWYSMPEIGDEVRLTIPDDEENNAYVASSVHLESNEGRIEPSHKSWKNPQGKEVLFMPDCLMLRNNNGLMIELSDHTGINIVSDKDITIQSQGQIGISSSNADIKMNADNQISFTQGSANICMKDTIDVFGGKINMN